jgi:hypothetical protein
MTISLIGARADTASAHVPVYLPDVQRAVDAGLGECSGVTLKRTWPAQRSPEPVFGSDLVELEGGPTTGGGLAGAPVDR